jgi:RluA family pseudouridine synthase
VLWRDEDLVAVDKPAGQAAIPERVGDARCLQARLADHLHTRIWVVHRLDKEVSGVMLYALHAEAHRQLNAQFASRQTGKEYRAVCHGRVAADAGVVDAPIHQFGSGRMGVDPRGKPSRTRYEVRDRWEAFTSLAVFPESGRRHQIRAHLYHLGHPITGDVRFGDRAVQARFPRLFLHACALEFTRPAGGRQRVECPPPPEFAAPPRASGDGP